MKALIKWIGHQKSAAVYLPKTVGVHINNLVSYMMGG